MMHTVTRYPLILFFLLGLLLPAYAPAQEESVVVSAADLQLQETINTLHSLIKLQAELKRDISDLGKQLAAAETVSEKNEIQTQLDKLVVDLQTTTRNLREIGAGADIASLRATEEPEFSLQQEFFALLKPALKELKDMTSHVRQKSELKDKIASYREKLPVAELAVNNIAGLIASNEDESLERYLEGMLMEWRKQLTVIESELQSAELEQSRGLGVGHGDREYVGGARAGHRLEDFDADVVAT